MKTWQPSCRRCRCVEYCIKRITQSPPPFPPQMPEPRRARILSRVIDFVEASTLPTGIWGGSRVAAGRAAHRPGVHTGSRGRGRNGGRSSPGTSSRWSATSPDVAIYLRDHPARAVKSELSGDSVPVYVRDPAEGGTPACQKCKVGRPVRPTQRAIRPAPRSNHSIFKS
jgi:hypothetical protein